MKYIISYDLGTGGMKSTLFDAEGKIINSAFEQCETYYPKQDFREQNPQDWIDMLKKTTKELLQSSGIDKEDIVASGISGHSLGVVPVSKEGKLLLDRVPIWSDSRAEKEAQEFFESIDESSWYMETGNGFPAPLYGAFKIKWYKNNYPEIYEETEVFLGTKDYLNFYLTGEKVTDYSYASGSGVYDLVRCDYDDCLIKAFGIDKEKLPKIVSAATPIGKVRREVAEELGLSENMIVSAGGVDNACMGYGAGCVEEGSAYTSLGTSAWIAVFSHKPIVDNSSRPYVFAGLEKGTYLSAESIFSAGNTHRWVRDTLCKDYLKAEEDGQIKSAYIEMDKEAEIAPKGSNGVFMIPTLAGGTALDKSIDVKGAFVGLQLGIKRSDLIRASLEGICMALKIALNELEKQCKLKDEMLIVGGGAKSKVWMQLFADIYSKTITTSQVGENAGALGAMASAAIASGLWSDYSPLKTINKSTSTYSAIEESERFYSKLLKDFEIANDLQSELALRLKERRG